MDREAGGGIWGVEEAIHQGTSAIDKKMWMEIDALDYVIGGMLSMEGEDGVWKPVAFLSKSLNKTGRNYEIHDKEMLAIIRGLVLWNALDLTFYFSFIFLLILYFFFFFFF